MALMIKEARKNLPRKPTILVSSTVYGIEELLDRIYALLTTFGYEVWMSDAGTVFARSDKTAFENCLHAVERCDLFLGIITPNYGSGVGQGGLSITHQEIKRAIELNKPRWLLAHDHVVFARLLLNDLGYKGKAGRKKLKLKDGANSIGDLRVIDMYEDAIRNEEKNLAARKGNWVQKFDSDPDALLFVTAQFSRFQEVEKFLLENLSNPTAVQTQISLRQGGGKK